MNEDRLLSFLNLNKDSKRDSFMPKLDFGMNIGYSIFVGAFILLTCYTPLNLAFVISFVLLDIIFGLILIFNRNPAWQIVLDVLGMLFVSVKLFLGYILVSKWQFTQYGIPIFTWAHSIVFSLGLCFAIYMISWLYKGYQISKKYPVPIARKKIAKIASMKGRKKWPYVIVGVFSCPVVVAQLWYGRLDKFGLSIGFCLWILALIYICLFSAGTLKAFVILRYKVYRYFKNKNG